jgi:predicted nucleotide-binding protein (sugar kinase/HSP70/actin superfamily)
MNLEFFLGILNALNSGDVINEAAHAIRPYEVESGSTDRALNSTMDSLTRVFRGRAADIPSMGYAARFAHQLRDRAYSDELRAAAAALDKVEIDRLRVKPVVKITGDILGADDGG